MWAFEIAINTPNSTTGLKKLLISVLIPCHNAAPWLQQAVNSIRRQTYRNLEILIYDDGSTDETSEIVRRLAAEDPRIYATGGSSNQGIVHALNTMLIRAQGDYIARMDGDDISLPQRIEQQMRFLQEGNADLCGTWFQEFGAGIARAVRWPHRTSELPAAMLFQNTICHPTIMARREVFENFIYRSNYNLAEDYDLFVRSMARFRLANVPEVLLRYRRHRQQATYARRTKMEAVTRQIRLEALTAVNIEASLDEQRIHNLIRAPHSNRSMNDFEHIESWLLKLAPQFESDQARRIVASQWTRAAIRAAPLGWPMWTRYRASPLHAMLSAGTSSDLDLAVLAALRLDYGSQAFNVLRRLGLSA